MEYDVEDELKSDDYMVLSYLELMEDLDNKIKEKTKERTVEKIKYSELKYKNKLLNNAVTPDFKQDIFPNIDLNTVWENIVKIQKEIECYVHTKNVVINDYKRFLEENSITQEKVEEIISISNKIRSVVK